MWGAKMGPGGETHTLPHPPPHPAEAQLRAVGGQGTLPLLIWVAVDVRGCTISLGSLPQGSLLHPKMRFETHAVHKLQQEQPKG